MANQGIVTCVMPVRNGHAPLGRSIWCFLRQDYASSELLVLIDTAQRIDAEIPADRRIQLVRTEFAGSATTMKLARDLAQGEYIAHWELDAWYSRTRLSAQLRHLEECGGTATALAGMLYYQPLTGQVWRCADLSGGLHPGTLLYRRDDPPTLPPTTRNVVVQQDAGLAAVILRGSDPGSVNPADPSWRACPFADIARTLGPDLTSYAPSASALNWSGSQRRRTPSNELAPTTVAGTFMVYDGFGSMAEYLAVGMSRAGADVRVAPFRIDTAATSAEFRKLLDGPSPDPDGVVLAHAWWGENLARFGSAQDLFVKTVWESSRLPADWPSRLNEARAVLVPSDFAARVFRESGVRVPVEVAYEGVDPDVYPFVQRPEPAGLTTLIVGVLAPRKNYRKAVAAWKLAFEGDPDARLILKARFHAEAFVPDDPRIIVVDDDEPTRGILHWYRKADILLALGNEGFGLPVVEGMATGLPVVALDAEAQADIVADCRDGEGPAVLPVAVAGWEQVNSPVFGEAGVRAIPDVDDAARQLRWVADHRAEALQLGRRASVWAHANRNVWDMGPRTLSVLERYASTPRPLRVTYAVWAATPCEAAGDGDAVRAAEEVGTWSARHYARNVARYAGQAVFHDHPPTQGDARQPATRAAWRSSLLHVHVAWPVDEEALIAHVQAARQRGISIIITEHGREANGCAHAWEQLADVLIAVEESTAATLRSLWPFKRVEVLPLGCPPWRASRADGAGHGIAVLAVEADSALRAQLDQLANAVGSRWFLLPKDWSAAADDGEWLASWLNRSADAVLAVRGGGATPLLEGIALASGSPVLAMDRADLGPDYAAHALWEALHDPSRRDDLVGAARERCAESVWPRVGALHRALWQTVMT
ncbi:glycosyltransferase [Microbacterium ureisolvens]|uniref:glycosyltransferase n=1 Tax=Microbacterium ureisolvens TaxID=2781186 RepID=UPI00363AD17E